MDKDPFSEPTKGSNGTPRRVGDQMGREGRKQLQRIAEYVQHGFDELRRIRRQEIIAETPEEDVWQDPVAFAAWKRRKEFEAINRLEMVRSLIVDALSPGMKALQKEVDEGRFDPSQLKAFASLQLLLATVPKSVSEMSKILDSLAQVLGHAKGPKEGKEEITEESIRDALIRMMERASSIPAKKSPPRLRSKEKGDAGSE